MTKSEPSTNILPEKQESRNKKWLLISVLVAFFVLLILAVTWLISFEIAYQDRLFPGTKIGSVNLSGLKPEAAANLLDQLTNQLESDGLKIIYKNGERSDVAVTPAVSAIADPDLSRQIFSFNNQATTEKISALGRQGSFWRRLFEQAKLVSGRQNLTAEVALDQAALKQSLEQSLSQAMTPAQNARPQVIWSGSDYEITIDPEQAGFDFSLDEVAAKIKQNLGRLNNSPIEIAATKQLPDINQEQALASLPLLEQALAATTPTFVFSDKSWTPSKKSFSQMLVFERNQTGDIVVGFDTEELKVWLEKNVAPEVEVEAKNATAELKNGQITKLSAQQEGRQINLEQTEQNADAALALATSTIELAVTVVEPDVSMDEVNDLGIQEIIGTGHSNFAGSPANRRHNIKTGASKLHGVLIEPGEEFSLINTLGPVEKETGYLPELVIKDNRTVPEYGGGLCQIGTTVFRAAMASGLPVTERKNHSYSVTYYLENGLPGVDATIYIPKPDVRFVNDTGHYILIQARIEGNDLYFDFWGQADGRQAERTKPKVWGWTSPPATKYVETTDLKPGEKKCTESSHKGVNASFDYAVTYPDGEKKTTTFTSHYKPWQAVCLIGVESLTPEDSSGTATSTDATVGVSE